MSATDAFHRELAHVARGMQGEVTSDQTMQQAVDAARALVEGCDIAAVSIVRATGIDTPVISHPHARDIDELQYELREGPCFDVMHDHESVHSNDIGSDPRWPRWGPRVVAEIGTHSVVSYRLFASADTIGALNLYGRSRSAFTTDDIHHGVALAAHVGVALAGAQEVEQLTTALDTRTLIGQATGILMERFDLTPDRAFATLSRLSQTRNVKLRAIAEHITTTRRREIPDT